MSSAARVLSGVQAVQAARRLEKQQRDEWPYLHVFPPPNSVPVNQISFQPMPAAGSSVVVLAYRVPAGERFFLQSIWQVAADVTVLPGSVLWTVTDNEPTGLSDTQAMPIQGLINVPVPLGSLDAGTRWPFERAYEFEADHLIQSVGSNVNAVGGFLVSGFFGYTVPDL